jgi:2-oxoglutarate dehydrogenase E1 component
VIGEKTQDFSLASYNFNEADLGRKFKIPEMTFIGGSEKTLPLDEIIERLRKVYSGSIAIEYMHLNNFDRIEWIRRKFETPGVGELTAEEKKRTLKRFSLHLPLFLPLLGRKILYK